MYDLVVFVVSRAGLDSKARTFRMVLGGYEMHREGAPPVFRNEKI